MSYRKPQQVIDLDKVNLAHKTAFDFAVDLNKQSARQYEGSEWNTVARSALSVINHESVCFHRAIGDLAYQGWAFAAPVLLRTQMEGMLSTLAITQSKQANLAGFKFFYAYAKDMQSDPNLQDEARDELKTSIRRHMKQLSEEDQELAKDYLHRQKLGGFWYADEFGGPTALLKKFSDKEQLFLYRKLSAAAHFGFLGLRFFRDEPEKLSVEPRQDRRALGMTLIGSSRFLLEIARLRAIFEKLPQNGYRQAMNVILECDPRLQSNGTHE